MSRSPFSPARAPGFALPAAIFLMVVLAALGAFLVNISVQQHSGHAADVQGVRAYQAARAGIEWGLYDFVRNGNCAGGGLVQGAFTVTVTCAAQNNDVAGTAQTSARIVATACNQPAAGGVCPNVSGANYVERQISVVAVRP